MCETIVNSRFYRSGCGVMKEQRADNPASYGGYPSPPSTAAVKVFFRLAGL